MLKVVSFQVQEESAHFQIAMNLCNTLPSLFVCLIYGSWSDKVGRKPIIVLGMFGSLLDTICVFLTILLELPLSFVLVGNFFNGIGGYITGLLLAVMAYVADTTGENDRALRLGMLIMMLSSYSCQNTSLINCSTDNSCIHFATLLENISSTREVRKFSKL